VLTARAALETLPQDRPQDPGQHGERRHEDEGHDEDRGDDLRRERQLHLPTLAY